MNELTAEETLAELSHESKVALYVINMCQSMKDLGLLTGGPSMTAGGKAVCQLLQEAGFEPTKEEMEKALNDIMHHG